MKFLIDRCAGRRLADWLRERGHDVADLASPHPDPGDRALLERAANENRILVTIDTDFGTLVHLEGAKHAGIIRLPDVPASHRIELLKQLLSEQGEAMSRGAVITVRGGRIRVSSTSG